MKHLLIRYLLPVLLSHLSVCLPQTENEIEEAKKIIKSRGLSESQVRSIARSKGYTDNDINEIVKKELLKEKNNSVIIDQSETANDDYIKSNEELNVIKKKSLDNPSNLIELKVPKKSINFKYEDLELITDSIALLDV